MGLMKKLLTISALALLLQFAAAPPTLAQASAAQAAGKTQPSPLAPSEIVAAAPQADWTKIAASDLLVMELAPDAKGRPRRVVIQLMPSYFSHAWTMNIRKLAEAHWWDGLSINRVQDNYVVQWGDPNADDKAKTKPLPAGLLSPPEWQYRSKIDFGAVRPASTQFCNRADSEIVGGCPEWDKTPPLTAAKSNDAYAGGTGFFVGWPIATETELGEPQKVTIIGTGQKLEIREASTYAWPVHCYGMVGVGRDLSPNTGSGAELYVVIGHAPRHLDRNIALVGRVIEGIEFLSSLPRGHGGLGFYDLEQGDERVSIQSIHPGIEVKDLPAYEYLSTESASFAKYADARANRRDAFFIRPAGGADICNIPVPVRRIK